MTLANPPTLQPSSNKKRFLINVVWSWIGVAVNLVLGIVLSPTRSGEYRATEIQR